jgi:hypothetical protein
MADKVNDVYQELACHALCSANHATQNMLAVGRAPRVAKPLRTADVFF